MKKLKAFVTTDKQWILDVGKCLFDLKKQDPDEYMWYLCKGELPVDEVGLFIFAKMYDIHIGVINGMQYWTTRKDINFKKCDIKLIYVGRLFFIDTIEGKLTPDLNLELQVKIYKSGYCATKISTKDLKDAYEAVWERRCGEHLKPMADDSFDQNNENNMAIDNNENNMASDNNGNNMDRDDLLSIAPFGSRL